MLLPKKTTSETGLQARSVRGRATPSIRSGGSARQGLQPPSPSSRTSVPNGGGTGGGGGGGGGPSEPAVPKNVFIAAGV